VVAHSAAGKLQGLADDRVWYELAYVAGVTNGLNAVADGLDLPLEFVPSSGAPPAGSLTESDGATAAAKDVLAEIAAFYAMERAPAVFRWMARDPRFLQGYWSATREVFSDGILDRLTKEVLAWAASLTAKSRYGADFHLREVRRLGLSEDGVTEVVEVVQCFNTVTKIADALQLAPDFDHRAGSSNER
jgi:alkylhydroperoxidase/carboxymuconolactone decarboxylase family protein YurZ